MTLWERIKALVSPKPRVIVDGGSMLVRERAVWDQAQRIGGGLTPADVGNILRQADGGEIYRAVELSQESRQKDGHMHMVLRARETWLSEIEWVVEPWTDDEDSEPLARDVEMAAMLRESTLGAVGDGDGVRGFHDLVESMQGAIFLGHSTDETLWGKRGRNIFPVGWWHVDQRRFGFRQRDGRLVVTDAGASSMWSSSRGVDGVDLRQFRGQFITHQPREMGDIPLREGLWRLLVWCALFRNWSIADWLKLAELAWKPWRLGMLKRDTGSRDRDNLINMLEQLTSSGVAVYNEDKAELDIRWPEGMAAGGRGKSAHHELCEFMAAEMSKAVRGNTLTSEAGDRGARSLGEVHAEGEKVLRSGDARRVNGTLRRDYVAPFVELNAPPGTPLPNTYFATQEAVDMKAFAEGIEKLNKAGLRIPARHVYDVTGIPAPSPDDEVLGEGEEDVDVSGLDQDDDEDQDATPSEGNSADGEGSDDDPEE